MAYKNISGKPTKGVTKDIDQPIMGGFMNTGRQKSRIKAIEDRGTSAMISFINEFNESHRQNIFLLDRDGLDIGYPMKQLLASICSTPDEILEIAAGLIDGGCSILSTLIDRELDIMLERTDGYRIRTTKVGIEAIYHGTIIGTAPDVSLLKLDEGYSEVTRSFINVKSYHRTGEKHEQRQSFFTTSTTPAETVGTNSTGNVGKERARPLPESRRFF